MYKRDVERIKKYTIEGGPEALVDVGSFVLATIQTPFSRVAPLVKDIKAKGETSEALWGYKRAGYSHLWTHRRELYQMLVETPAPRAEALMRCVQVPGLGLVKAGFLLQLIGYETACLDRHNVKRYGIDPKVVKSLGKPTEEKANAYLAVCDKLGTSESHYDTWCEYVAGNRYNKLLDTADRVSAYHYEAITC